MWRGDKQKLEIVPLSYSQQNNLVNNFSGPHLYIVYCVFMNVFVRVKKQSHTGALDISLSACISSSVILSQNCETDSPQSALLFPLQISTVAKAKAMAEAEVEATKCNAV